MRALAVAAFAAIALALIWPTYGAVTTGRRALAAVEALADSVAAVRARVDSLEGELASVEPAATPPRPARRGVARHPQCAAQRASRPARDESSAC